MRSSFIATTGLKLARSPNAREQAARRRLAVVVSLLALVLAGSVVGVVTAPRGESAARADAFSYFPSE